MQKQISHAVNASLDVCHLVKLEDEPQDLATFEVLFLEGILFLLKVDSATKFARRNSRKGGIEFGIQRWEHSTVGQVLNAPGFLDFKKPFEAFVWCS